MIYLIRASIWKPIYARTGKDLDAVADEDINLDLVLEQRRIEFWGEGQRFFDLLRNNKKVIRRLFERSSQ